MNLDSILYVLGYIPADDSWETDGRCTYINDDDATRAYMAMIRGVLARQGWNQDPEKLRTFRHFLSLEVIEIEPGGAGCTGHYLHHFKPEVIDAPKVSP